jgi:hypothetical protein
VCLFLYQFPKFGPFVISYLHHFWLRHCATSRKVVGSISDDVTGIFHWHNPSGRIMALVLTLVSSINEYHEHFLGNKGGR